MARIQESDPWRHYFPSLIELEHILIAKGWQYVGYGRHRRVLKRGNVVLKIPYQPDGMTANLDEYALYKANKGKPDPRTGVYYAPCRLLPNGCLMMRFVNTKIRNKDFYKLPKWALEMCDGPQVGWDRTGRLVAYDYADERYDRFDTEYSGDGPPSHRSTRRII